MSIAILSPSCILEPSSSTTTITTTNPLLNSLRFCPKILTISPRKPFWQRKQRYVQASRVRAISEDLASSSSNNNRYHPSEDINELVVSDDDARLTDAETARTLVEVNSKAILMFSGLTDDEIHENIIWTDLPYLTDEHGDIYFEVSNNEDILQTLIGDDKIVKVIIGLDNTEMLDEMEISGASDFDFGMEEIVSGDSDIDDDSDEDVFTILEDEDDDLVSSETSNDWTNLETMQSSHPMYFGRKIAEVVSNINMDLMDHPSASILVQGVLRPAFVEEHSFLKNHSSVEDNSDDEASHLQKVVEENMKEELDSDQSLPDGTAFYRLEMIRIQLVSSYGTQPSVEVQDFRKAQPDVVMHHAAKIIAQLEASGDRTVQALKSLCWRLKNIQVEEATITGVDSLGFDLRVCSGTQVQTLRFAFNTRATSELLAERKLHDLLFPR